MKNILIYAGIIFILIGLSLGRYFTHPGGCGTFPKPDIFLFKDHQRYIQPSFPNGKIPSNYEYGCAVGYFPIFIDVYVIGIGLITLSFFTKKFIAHRK